MPTTITIDGILQAVEAREAQVSTALGGGLAVPHGRTDLVRGVRVAAGLVRDVPDYRRARRYARARRVPRSDADRARAGKHVKLLRGSRGSCTTPRPAPRCWRRRLSAEFMRVIRDAEAA